MKDRISRSFTAIVSQFPADISGDPRSVEFARWWYYAGFNGCLTEQAALSRLQLPSAARRHELEDCVEEAQAFFAEVNEAQEDAAPSTSIILTEGIGGA